MTQNKFWKLVIASFILIQYSCISPNGKDSREVSDVDSSEIYTNGVGFIKHNSVLDMNTTATLEKLGEETWNFSRKHKEAKKLTLIIIDECKNM
jgi:hypothetical protein